MTARYLVLEDSPRGFDAYRGVSHGIPWPERLSSRDAETLRIDRATSFAGDLDGVISYVSLCCKSTPWLRVLALYGGLLDVPPPAIPLVPSVFIGYDVWTTTQYSLIEQAVLGGVPDGTHAVALQPALNGFGLFDTPEDAQRLRLLWKADPESFDVFGVDDVHVSALYWVLSLPGCDVELVQPELQRPVRPIALC